VSFVNIHSKDQASGRASTEYYIPLARYGNIASFSCGRLERSKELENKAQIPSHSKTDTFTVAKPMPEL